MSRAVLATVLLSACTFTPGSIPPPPTSTETPDAMVVPVGQPDAYQMNACHSRLPGVQLCLDFEESNLAHDSTGLPYSILVQDVDLTMRGSEHAALLKSSSNIHVHDAPPLDFTGPMSMEMWVNPAAPSPNQPEAFLVSSLYEFGFSIANSQLFCGFTAQGGNSSVDVGSSVSVPAGQWTHVACVFDGVAVKVYVGGAGAGCRKQPMTIETNVRDGLDLGYALDGGLDDLHLYNTALGDDDICTLAGRTGCAPAKCD